METLEIKEHEIFEPIKIEGLNEYKWIVITANENNVGKTSLLKHIFENESGNVSAVLNKTDMYPLSKMQENIFKEVTGYEVDKLKSDSLKRVFGILGNISTTKEREYFDAVAKGLVIIDDFDANLHIDTQRKLIKALSKYLPNTQFIVSVNDWRAFMWAKKVCWLVVERNGKSSVKKEFIA